jgi:hypothetical protein
VEPSADERALRPFVYGLAGAVIGVGVLLFAYDRFVVAPRESQRAQEVKVNLEEGRTEAQDIAKGLDASGDRTLERARAGFEDVASEQDKARLANEALSRGAMYRVAISEVYMSNGAWPENAAAAGLPVFDANAPGAVQDIVVGPGGKVAIVLREPFAGSRFVLEPRAGSDGSIAWSCRSEGDAELRRYARACVP